MVKELFSICLFSNLWNDLGVYPSDVLHLTSEMLVLDFLLINSEFRILNSLLVLYKLLLKWGLHIAAMTNQQLMDNGNRTMDETDQAIERSKKVSASILVHSTQ